MTCLGPEMLLCLDNIFTVHNLYYYSLTRSSKFLFKYPQGLNTPTLELSRSWANSEIVLFIRYFSYIGVKRANWVTEADIYWPYTWRTFRESPGNTQEETLVPDCRPTFTNRSFGLQNHNEWIKCPGRKMVLTSVTKKDLEQIISAHTCF